jgi:hypothetical protein
MDLEKLFSGEAKFTVCRIAPSVDLAALPALAAAHQYALFVFEGSAIQDKGDFLDQFEQVMQPLDYGRNWDSFEENLEALDWIDAKGVIVLYKDFQPYVSSSKGDFEIMVDIFIQTIHFRKRRSVKSSVKPLHILLQDGSNLDIPIDWCS